MSSQESARGAPEDVSDDEGMRGWRPDAVPPAASTVQGSSKPAQTKQKPQLPVKQDSLKKWMHKGSVWEAKDGTDPVAHLERLKATVPPVEPAKKNKNASPVEPEPKKRMTKKQPPKPAAAVGEETRQQSRGGEHKRQ